MLDFVLLLPVRNVEWAIPDAVMVRPPQASLALRHDALVYMATFQLLHEEGHRGHSPSSAPGPKNSGAMSGISSCQLLARLTCLLRVGTDLSLRKSQNPPVFDRVCR